MEKYGTEKMKRTVSELETLEDNAITASAAASKTLETYPYDILCGSNSGPPFPNSNG